ncbi:MAG: AraC family transcriptional regulator [Pseudomonadota bacterium]|nr:AraC family transcriptional regulator [Pseudomonadota bacterium]
MNSVSIAYLRALLDYVQARGVDPARLLEGTAIKPDDRESRVPEFLAAALFDRAAELLDDPHLGLHVGESVRPGHYGVLGYVAMNCSNLGEALECLRRYQALVIDLGGVCVATESDLMVLSWQPETDPPFRQLAEFNLSGLLSFTRWMAGRNATVRRIDFIYPAPTDLSEHQRIFGCELRYGQSAYRLAVPLSWLSAPLMQPDPAMRELMLRLADSQLLELPRSDDVLARARAMIAARLKHAPVDLDWLAAQLAQSPRSLQRRLSEQSLSFSQLVEAVRRELAERCLADPLLDVTDVAFLLGYSEQSAFQRAFKRWTGETPAQWRGRQG